MSSSTTESGNCHSPLLNLPNELLIFIIHGLHEQADLYSLFLTNHRFRSLVSPYLLKFAARGRGHQTALQWATHRGHIGLVRLLLKEGLGNSYLPDILLYQRDCNPPLSRAIRLCTIPLISLLLDHGEDINGQDELGNTVMHAVVEEMVYREKQRYSPSWDRHLAVNRARATQMPDVLKFLLDRKPNLEIRNRAGKTPLHIVAADVRWTSATVLKILLEHGADVDIKTTRGRTPLYLAAKSDITSNVKLLIQYGADVNARANDWSTPIWVSDVRGDVYEILKEHGGTR